MPRWLDEADLRELCARDRDVYVRDDGTVLKRAPASMLPGGVEYVVGFTDPARVRLARLHRERVEQKLDAIEEKLAEARARSEAVAVVRPTREHIAAVLREEYAPHGVPPRGQGWEKGAEKKLKARGVDTCRAEYFHAVKLNKRLRQ